MKPYKNKSSILLLLLCSFLILTNTSCKGPVAKAVTKAVTKVFKKKPEVTPLRGTPLPRTIFKAGSYTYEELVQISTIIVTRHPISIFNSEGRIVGHAFSSADYGAAENALKGHFADIVLETLQLLNNRGVYHDRIHKQIKYLLKSSSKTFEEFVSYNEQTGELIITANTYHTKIDYGTILKDISVAGPAGYIVLKQDFS